MTARVIPFPRAYRDRITSESTGVEHQTVLDPNWVEPAWTDPDCDCQDCIHDAQQAALRASVLPPCDVE